MLPKYDPQEISDSRLYLASVSIRTLARSKMGIKKSEVH